VIGNFRIGTGWKMNHTLAMARTYASLLAAAVRPAGIQLFVLPPATALTEVVHLLKPTNVMVGAQNAHWAEQGAWTGEISMTMVADAGATLIELGHSERRAYFGETDVDVNRKVKAALRHGLTPLVCVGETADDRRLGAAVETNARQARMALAGLTHAEAARVWLAYEPVWAIGEGGIPATPEDAQPVHAAIKRAIIDLLGVEPPVLYGGSVNQQNAKALAVVPEVDGLFVGRSAWTAEGLLKIAEIAVEARKTAELSGR
jgi:triosephosphate isomerase